MNEISTVAAIVVHHQSLSTIGNTLQDLVRAGVPRSNIVIVDNSEDAGTVAALEASAPEGALVVTVANEGYASAVNHGRRLLGERSVPPDYVLVATHEIRIDPDSVRRMVDTMSEQPSAGAVGPLLLRGESEKVWSAGGFLTSWLMHPWHAEHGRSRSAIPANQIECDWLDGALVLYRSKVFSGMALPELYFLYFEELDFHTTLRHQGWKVVCDRRSVARQQSHGTPLGYRGRNMQIFMFRHASMIRVLVSTPTDIARHSAKALLGRARFGEVTAMVGGWLAAWKLRLLDGNRIKSAE
ncbi:MULTISPECIES: glycosyltransferase family 2 protein [unclassified Micromonospora]|uniref:glycosyltransferase family 2 protein n=1 Tax=unclassified Micromonospora TaxID=2617518 RepID=UPI002FF1E9FC